MRLIDADELRDTIENEHFGEYEDKETTFYCIDTAPTVNAVVVTHGHWETNSDRPDSLICSVCKCGFDMWKHDPHNYCPNCGSKMDGGNDDAAD